MDGSNLDGQLDHLNVHYLLGWNHVMWYNLVKSYYGHVIYQIKQRGG